MTIRTIINHCSNDFNICLIDDNSFSRLIPSWDIDLASVAKPMRSHYREIGMLQLLYYYGGMLVPNSFLCMQNLKSMYDQNTRSLSGKSMPFACERVNNTVNQLKDPSMFLPTMYFMGAKKNDETIHEFVEYLKARNMNPHFTKEVDFKGDSSQWLNSAVKTGKMNLVDGRSIGIKNTSGKPILLDNLFYCQ